MLPSRDRLRQIEAHASRAANTHNTQPWELRYGEDHIEVGWRTDVLLGPGDPSHRDLRLSLGAYVETFLIAAAEAGVSLDFAPDLDPDATRAGRLLPAARPYATEFGVRDIAGRRVWRGAWRPEPVPADVLACARKTAQASGFRLAAISTAAARPVVSRASRWFFGDEGITAELMDWTRLGPRHPDYHRDGLNDVMLVLGRVERLLMGLFLSRVVYRLLRPVGLPRLLATSSARATAGDGTVMVLLAEGGDSADEVAAGRLLTRLWLGLHRQGLCVHPQSQVIDCPRTVEEVRRLSGAAEGERPLAFFRVGTPVTDPSDRPRHPRRDLPPH
ncbi:hypothetical protein ACH4C2_35700 [Streptomyces sp. NPDC018057]|uniref:hypothetical protein n=1 Tax=unclassified Streptomyces TaxID=2593676 RepID=UPI0037AB2F0B